MTQLRVGRVMREKGGQGGVYFDEEVMGEGCNLFKADEDDVSDATSTASSRESIVDLPAAEDHPTDALRRKQEWLPRARVLREMPRVIGRLHIQKPAIQITHKPNRVIKNL